MKSINWILLLISYSLLSCTGTVIRDEIEYVDRPHEPCTAATAPIYLPGEMIYGRVSGLKNCEPFMGSAELSLIDINGVVGADIIIDTYEDWGNQNFVRKEAILVGALCNAAGTYSMYFPAFDAYEASYTIVKDFDVLEDVFKPDSAYKKNEITFSLYDRSVGHAQGFFNCRFLLDKRQPSGVNPDTVIFNNCYFDAWKR